ncbi:hypothetical protein L596_024243 [Steinernema carpocapsae]|uniref:N-acetyltransferase domain-containing protein n=1 Tax=Steinernema carpocapsae TaxID=34508 RepID=A0A4U5MG77_STECR|nr:hypothetical protein L596_024243 [Steinernema carpocapsae]
MNFKSSDVECFIRPTVEKCLKSRYSVVVFEKTSFELIGIRLISIWKRPYFICSKSVSSLPTRLIAFFELMSSFKTEIWRLCSYHVDVILRREFSCVRKDFQRRGIGSRMADMFIDRKELKERGIGGIMSETSSIANQSLLAKKGFKALAELRYAHCFDKEGNRIVERDFHDGSPKIVLNFLEF